jgi:hypothetical protein
MVIPGHVGAAGADLAVWAIPAAGIEATTAAPGAGETPLRVWERGAWELPWPVLRLAQRVRN